MNADGGPANRHKGLENPYAALLNGESSSESPLRVRLPGPESDGLLAMGQSLPGRWRSSLDGPVDRCARNVEQLRPVRPRGACRLMDFHQMALPVRPCSFVNIRAYPMNDLFVTRTIRMTAGIVNGSAARTALLGPRLRVHANPEQTSRCGGLTLRLTRTVFLRGRCPCRNEL